MTINFSKLSTSDYAAWWGATIATLALLWNIIVAIRAGARIKVSVTPNMQMVPSTTLTQNKHYISVKAVNHGSSPTTITHCGGFHTRNLWGKITGNKQHYAINIDVRLGRALPCTIGPGEEWNGYADQTDLLNKLGDGNIYIGIYHNQKSKPILKRIKTKSLS